MIKTKSRTEDELRKICHQLTIRQYNKQAYDFTLPEISRLYTILTLSLDNHAPRMSIVNIGNCLFIQFSDICPQHFLVTSKKPLLEDDFAFVPNKVWHGTKEKTQTFFLFLLEELRINKFVIISIFISAVVLIFLGYDDLLVEKISELVLQATTVFLSIYLIFTVTQNDTISKDRKLFEQGITHKFFTDDRNLSILAIITIIASVFNILLLGLLKQYSFSLNIYNRFVVDYKFILSITSGLITTIMVDTFLSVINYYFYRTRNILDRNMVSTILDEDLEKYHPDYEAKENHGNL